MSSKKKTIVYGTAILSITGFMSRLIGFFYKIFLSQTIGAAEIGIFQMIIPAYTLALTLCVGGISTVMARMIAASSIHTDSDEGWSILLTGTFVSAMLALLVSMLMHLFSHNIARYYFKDSSHADILRILSWSVLPSSLHSCLMSYYYAKKKAVCPAIAQFLEQIVRVLSSLLLYAFFCSRQLLCDATLPAVSILFGELASCQYSLLMIFREAHKKPHSQTPKPGFLQTSGRILSTSLPLTANRVSLMLLQSVEAVLIPRQLQLSGATTQEAFSIYGVFTGMALPLILFPNTLANAASVMLLPGIAEDQAVGNHKSIRKTTRAAMTLCLLTGGAAAVFFLFFGKSLGLLLFGSLQAGLFLQILSFISPFLYLNATLSGILHGLGKTGASFVIGSSGLTLRILFVLFAIPVFGIRGYLYGILASELLSCLITLLFLRPYYS
ncbi:MAG: oligosaccharide flippase family protein [Lachnospiraceae bacterium]|nr:oligosaccharide flippase family protein [Lachnospiraceae bacterium]